MKMISETSTNDLVHIFYFGGRPRGATDVFSGVCGCLSMNTKHPKFSTIWSSQGVKKWPVPKSVGSRLQGRF